MCDVCIYADIPDPSFRLVYDNDSPAGILIYTGYRVLVDLFELPSGVKQIWIIELLSTTSDLAFNRTDVLIMLVVGLLYAVISTSLGVHFFKVQKL